MAYVKKTWKPRISQYPGRRRMVGTGEANTYDITRAEGTVTQTGDAFSADNMNDLETRIGNEFTAINNNLSWSKLSESAVVGSTNPVNRDFTQYRELLIVVGENTTGSNTRFSFHIPTACLTETVQRFRNGYYRDSNANAFCSVGATRSTLYVTDFNINGTSYMSNTNNLRIVYAR